MTTIYAEREVAIRRSFKANDYDTRWDLADIDCLLRQLDAERSISTGLRAVLEEVNQATRRIDKSLSRIYNELEESDTLAKHLEVEVDRLHTKIHALRVALVRYGAHERDCERGTAIREGDFDPRRHKCTCGLEAAIPKVDEGEAS